MRLSIIPVDGSVIVDGKGYARLSWEGTPSNVHALQWFDNKGWIEYNDGQLNEDIALLPDWVFNAQMAWAEANEPPPPPGPPTAEQNANMASALLFATDWVENPTVRDTSLTPHLVNPNEFDAYRLQLRAIAVYPAEGELNWPVKPSPVWA